jgi:hypothetical protein
MVKNEQLRGVNQQIRSAPTVSLAPPPPPPPPPPPSLPMHQTTAGILSQRLIDSNAIDITSLKGQFAWEKIAHSDAYMPVIFRYVNNNHISFEFQSSSFISLLKERQNSFFFLYDLNKLKKRKST